MYHPLDWHFFTLDSQVKQTHRDEYDVRNLHVYSCSRLKESVLCEGINMLDNQVSSIRVLRSVKEGALMYRKKRCKEKCWWKRFRSRDFLECLDARFALLSNTEDLCPHFANHSNEYVNSLWNERFRRTFFFNFSGNSWVFWMQKFEFYFRLRFSMLSNVKKSLIFNVHVSSVLFYYILWVRGCRHSMKSMK